MAEDSKYRGRLIPDHILEMDAGYQKRKLIRAFKEWVDMDIDIEAYPHRYYYVTNPETGVEIELDFMKPKTNVYKSLGQGKDPKTKKYHYPTWLTQKEKDEIDKYTAELIAMKLGKGRKYSEFNKPLKLSSPTALLKGHRDLVVQEMAKGKTIDEIRDILEDKYKVAITREQLREFRLKNLTLIEQERSSWQEKQGISLLVEAEARVQKLAYLYNTNEQKYEEQNYPIPRANMMLKILEQIRKEIEGDKIVLDINGKIDVDLTVNVNHTFNKLLGEVPLMSFIVAIIAAKKNINPLNLMAQLQRSIYARYSGIKGILAEDEHQDLGLLPSNQVYDWLQLQNVKQQDMGYVELELSNKAENDKVSDVRKRLLELIQDERNEL